ncbi:hypothetical protein [Variovorax sp. PAMC 28711]|uniref:hypothetical protein n=1 Tax=Variovorax sp. PAMC 28711 TaxID=1795631 RepID=UPI00078E430A|nr:hypothetical protein [Variovorax sp. PAMC 28711]AMM26315.1 hypothetical protein AX767_19625 [Variovorax sp. PAMC 28711]
MKIKSQKHFLAGVMFTCVVMSGATARGGHRVGAGDPVGTIAWKPLILIIGAVLLLMIVLLPAVKAKREEACVEE